MIARTSDAIVIGGGLVGAAIAHGLRQQGLDTVLLDEGDIAFRASRGNFGLVWVQSKGLGAPWYQRWTRNSAAEWPELAQDLTARTGLNPRDQKRNAAATSPAMTMRIRRSVGGSRRPIRAPT